MMLPIVMLSAGCDVHTADDHLLIAGELEAEGNSDSALYHLDEAVRKNPKHLWAHLERGVLRSYRDDQNGAIADDNMVLAMDPVNQTALFNRALAKGRKSDHTGAVTDLGSIMHIKSPGWDEDAPLKARAFLEPTGNIGLGIAPPEFDIPAVEVGYAFAMSYLALDSADKAYGWLSYCIDNGHRIPESLYERGVLLHNHGNMTAGCADLEQAAIQRHVEARKAWEQYCGNNPSP